MNKEKILIFLMSLVLIFSIALIIISFYLQKRDINQSSPIILPECTVIEYNGEEAINLVFLAPSLEIAEKYSKYLISFGPFSKYSDKFNSYFIQYDGRDCKLYKDIAVLCYSRESVRTASVCPNDVIFAVAEGLDSKIRSSSYMNFISINSKHPLSVLAHEFGHAFGYLADEYDEAQKPRNSKNCVGNCKEFNGLEEGCYSGCSGLNNKRSIEEGIMRTLVADRYGNFNDYLLTKEIKKIEQKSKITGKAISGFSSCKNRKYIEMVGSIDLEKKSVSFSEQSEIVGCEGGNGVGDDRFILYDEKNKIVKEGNFNPGYLYTDAPAEDHEISGKIVGSVEEVEYANFILKFSKEEKEMSKVIEIKRDQQKSTIPLSEIKDTTVSDVRTSSNKLSNFLKNIGANPNDKKPSSGAIFSGTNSKAGSEEETLIDTLGPAGTKPIYNHKPFGSAGAGGRIDNQMSSESSSDATSTNQDFLGGSSLTTGAVIAFEKIGYENLRFFLGALCGIIIAILIYLRMKK